MMTLNSMNDTGSISQSDSRDEQGRYCGMIDTTGETEPTPDGKCGYCGPNCEHCKSFRVYGLNSDGVWACAADADYLTESPYYA